MRILQLAPPWFTVPPTGYGGIEWVVSLLADGLVDAGHDVTLLASGGSRSRARVVTVFDEPPTGSIGSPHHDLVHCLAGYRRRHEFDLVHDHSGFLGPVLGSLVDGPPVVHTLHGPWTPEVAALHRALPPALRLVAISHDQRRRAPRGLPLAGVVHNGIAAGLYPFDGRVRGRGGYLAFVGRANREKGPEVAVRVARRLGRPLRMAVKINEPEEQRYWRDVVVPLLDGADVEVVRDAPTDVKGSLLAGAEATLCPIQWDEPFGLVMVESMACGTPVVAYERGSAPEVVAHGETGLLVEPDDVDGLCDAVGRVGELDPAAARARVERLFSSEAMVRGYLEVYRRVVASCRVAAAR